MPMYTFQLRKAEGRPLALDAAEFDEDAGTFARAGELLEAHQSCDHIEVWEGDRAVVARHRDQPVLRPVEVAP